jgi:hypothetical protein
MVMVIDLDFRTNYPSLQKDFDREKNKDREIEELTL